jgi:hypothetical protein
VSLCLSDLPKEHINEFNGKKYIRLEVTERREPDKFGKTHTVTVDTWKPEEKQPESQTNREAFPVNKQYSSATPPAGMDTNNAGIEQNNDDFPF